MMAGQDAAVLGDEEAGSDALQTFAFHVAVRRLGEHFLDVLLTPLANLGRLRGADRPSLAVFRRDSLDRFVRFVEAVDDDRTVLGSCRRGSRDARRHGRSEEHTSELQSSMRISYAVFCLKKKKIQ